MNTSVLANVAAGGALFYGVNKLLKTLEGNLNSDTKRRISLWLRRADFAGPLGNWPATFALIFDRVFTNEHFSWKCFVRSAIASTSIFTFFATVHFAERALVQKKAVILGDLWFVLPIGIVANVVPDYLSLLKARWILHFMAAGSSLYKRVGLLLLDLLVTASMATAWTVGAMLLLIPLTKLIFNLANSAGLPSVAAAVGALASGTFWIWVETFPLDFLWPAFFTSIWLLLYVGAGFLFRSAQRLEIGIRFINRYFDVDAKPLESVGTVGAGLAVLTWWGAEGSHYMLSAILGHSF